MRCAAGGSGDAVQDKRRGTPHRNEEMGVSKGKMTKIKNLRVVTRASTQPEEVQWVEASANRDVALDGTMQEVRVSESEQRKTTEKKMHV